MEIQTRILGSGARNHSLVVKGILDSDIVEPQPIMVWTQEFKPKIVQLHWIVQEKMGLRLWWEEDEGIESSFITMESRNVFKPPVAVVPPDGWGNRLFLTSFGIDSNPYVPKHFWLAIDIDK